MTLSLSVYLALSQNGPMQLIPGEACLCELLLEHGRENGKKQLDKIDAVDFMKSKDFFE